MRLNEVVRNFEKEFANIAEKFEKGPIDEENYDIYEVTKKYIEICLKKDQRVFILAAASKFIKLAL